MVHQSVFSFTLADFLQVLRFWLPVPFASRQSRHIPNHKTENTKIINNQTEHFDCLVLFNWKMTTKFIKIAEVI